MHYKWDFSFGKTYNFIPTFQQTFPINNKTLVKYSSNHRRWREFLEPVSHYILNNSWGVFWILADWIYNPRKSPLLVPFFFWKQINSRHFHFISDTVIGRRLWTPLIVRFMQAWPAATARNMERERALLEHSLLVRGLRSF